MEKEGSSSFNTYLSLITINGKIHNVTLVKKFEKKSRRYDWITKVNNFYMIKLKRLDTTILLYSKGGFKITIGCNKNVIKNLNVHLERVLDMLALFFNEKITRVDMKITQVTILLRPLKNIAKTLTYKNMISKMTQKDNYIIYNKTDHKVYHEINFVAHECGQSSYYFTIEIENVRTGGIKIYNNFTAIMMCFDAGKIYNMVNICKDFLNYLKSITI